VKSKPLKESHEDMNSAKFSKALSSTSRKHQTTARDYFHQTESKGITGGYIEVVILAVSELSKIENNEVKVKIRIERLLEHCVAYVQLSDPIIS